jgi:hypothetical protein
MGLALGLGFYFHVPPAGMIAAGGTLSAGLGSFRRLRGSQLLPMLLTSFGMAGAALAGTMAGHAWAITGGVAGACGFAYGLLLVLSEDASWVALQAIIAFLVASAFPAWGWHGAVRAALVLGGGLLQTMLIFLFWREEGTISLRRDFRSCHPGEVLALLRDEIWPIVVRQIEQRRPAARYAVRLGLTLLLATVLSRLLHQTNAYWLPMTTLLVMKPDFYRTYTSSLGRVFGTFLGVVLASILAHGLRPDPATLTVLVLLFGWGTFSCQKVNYAIFTCALTAYIVFLVAIAGLPEVVVTANRLLDTALGSLLALGSRAIGPRWDIVAAAGANEPTRS